MKARTKTGATMPKDTVNDLYQRWSDTFAERGELPLDEWRELIEEWGRRRRSAPGRWCPTTDAIRRLADWGRPKVGL
jgi:hypothetical protein